MLRNVQFIGPLADRFGTDPIRFDFNDIAQMHSGLECLLPEFRQVLQEFDEFALFRKRGDKITGIPEEEAAMSYGGSDTIIFAAGVSGSALAAAGYVASALATYGTVAYAAVFVMTYVAMSFAIAYAAGAVMGALSSKPDMTKTERDKHASTMFNGAQNITEQGGAIAYIAGRFRVGATIISTEVTTERMAMMMPDAYTVPAGKTWSANVTDNDLLRERLTLNSWTLDEAAMTFGQVFTYTHPPIGPEDADPRTNYSLTMAADGTITVESEDLVNVNHKITYTATDTQTSKSATASVTLGIRGNGVWDHGGGGEGVGPGGAPGGDTASAGDAAAGDGGVGAGDGSGSGGGTGSA